MVEIYMCNKGCCRIHIKEYPELPLRHRGYSQKAGAFIYDPVENRVLLVQSRGQLWGSPKGTMEANETTLECAIREVMEETGLDISNDDLSKSVQINRSVYYYVERKSEAITIPETIDDNDATGITWIKVGCLRECVESGKLVINYQCKELLRKLFHIHLSVNRNPV